jgi:hypothetical protein
LIAVEARKLLAMWIRIHATGKAAAVDPSGVWRAELTQVLEDRAGPEPGKV